MKSILSSLVLMICLAVSTNIHAQQASKPEDRAAQITTWMKEKLNLSPTQIPQVETLNLKYAKLNQQIKDKPSLSSVKKLTESNTNKEAELQKILKPEQYKVYQAKKAEIAKLL